ncbi:RHS repeat-associated core domain-containing protein [Cellulomonas cellasea]|uniref:RHS repeat-associated protein n=1 Tax=Cellulomonas cellasea TaxID=43670 RepID=A0A7W4UG35_9CELL|nr:RHS repeat-associated core domain-containing protein [Cellulomonas cellasea]MBB2923532.1 RHS repeat-associated protein [Cellulomonas cellasea]
MAAGSGMRRTIVGVVTAALLATLGATVPAAANADEERASWELDELFSHAEDIAPERTDVTKAIPAKNVPAAAKLPRRPMPISLPTPPRFPKAWKGIESVAPEGAEAAPQSGDGAGADFVRVGRAPEAAAADAAARAGGAAATDAATEVPVEVLGQDAAEKAGVEGVLIRVGAPVAAAPAASAPEATPASTPTATPTKPGAVVRPTTPPRGGAVIAQTSARRTAAEGGDESKRAASETPTATPSATPSAAAGTPTPSAPATPRSDEPSTPAEPESSEPEPSQPETDAPETAEPEAAPAADVPLEVAVDYSSFAEAYGGGWSARLRLVSLPDCALTTPERAECRVQTPLDSANDVKASTVTAKVSATSVGVMAVAAGGSGSSGNFGATSLSPSSSWQVAGQTGTFSWSYPMRVPPSVGGPEPDLALSYSSGGVDGKVASTNNQSSWIGDGWDLQTGFLERKYVSCGQDATGSANNVSRITGDLCWSSDNATLALAGHSSELVKDAATGAWRLKEDDGTRVERLTGGFNDDNDGEYWKVTTTDGTQYFFGRGQRSATDTTKTNSAWSVPVFGNHPGEPCYNAAFASSSCMQTWRWNLEYIVDTSGNTLTTTYAKETNTYGRNLNTAVSSYVRGGYPTSIEYGQRAGSETAAPAPMRVEFAVAERCLPSAGVTCDPAQLNASTAASWPDVPADLICTSTTSCPWVTSPAFFTNKRLTGVTTQVRSGSAYQAVDAWSLTHTFPDPGDSTSKALWLDRIGHKGMVGTAIQLPDIRFYGVQMANRVDRLGDLGPPMNRFRLNALDTETGARISVNYTPQDCTSANLPASPESNTRRCFPVRWQPEGTGPQISEYFHKYLVTSVVENPNDDGSLSVQTAYTYHGDAAWRFDDNPLVPVAERTWNEFRGYATVDVVTGAPTAPQRSLSRTRYFRGMHGDRLPNGGTRSVLIDGIADEDRLNGFVREEVAYDGVGGAEISGTVNTPWVSAPTATGADGSKATLIGIGAVEERTAAPALPGGKRTTRITTTYDSTYGLTTQVDDQGDLATTADDRCTRVEYARSTAAHIVATSSRTEVVGVGCGVAPTRPTDVISDSRVGYDGLAVGAAPTRGLVTTTQSLGSYSGATPVYITDGTTTYDAHGRPTSTTDVLGRKSTTSYTPATGGPLTATSQTSPDPDGSGPLTAQTSTTEVNPAWGAPVRSIDPNGKVTSATSDALGRTTAVWLPGRPQATATPNMKFTYTVSNTGPNTVTTQALTANETYQSTVALYDGMLRPRQTQSTSAARGTPGRIVTDTKYDSRGLVDHENGSWFTTGEPSSTLVRATVAVPSRTRYIYDGAGRPTAEIFDVSEQERWRTTTKHEGDRVTVDPPDGTVPETSITDARGQIVELRQYTGTQPAGDYVATSYTYDRAGRQTAVTDAAGNRWTYTYDLRGRQIATTDPDKGASTTTYDDAGQVVSTTDARSRTSFTVRDGLGRPVEQREGSATGALQASWTYDTLAKGQPTSSTRHVAGAAYTTAITAYDDGYRPLGQSVTIPAAEGAVAGTYTTKYTYTPDGQQKRVVLPAAGGLGEETVSTYYDALSVPEKLAGGGFGAYVSSSLYDVYGELLQYSVGNAYVDFVNYSYETGTRRLSKTWTQREKVSGYDADTTYTYDAAGNPTSIVDRPTGKPVDAQCFTFDGLQRLSRAWTPANANCATAPSVAGLGGPAPYWTDYTFDVVGNRTSEVQHTAAGDTTRTYTYPAPKSARPHAVSQVTTTGPSGTTTDSYGYDASGNTTTRNRAGKPTQTLTWDADGRLSTVTESGTTTAGSYVYTPEGDRLIRRQGGVTTVYLPGGQELNLTVGTGAVKATRYYAFGGNIVAVRTGPEMADVTSLVNDPHATASLSINNATHAVTNRRMDPFGNARGGSPAWPGDHGFLNKPVDTTGLTQMGARYYDAAIGRFISVDPVMDLGKPQQWAAYSYADNNPITYWDPTGMLSWGSVWNSVKKGAKSAASGAAGFVKKYQADIVGFVAGGLVTAGCLAATGGVGSVGCLALGGAAGAAATNLWKTKVQKTQKFSWGGLARDTAVGGVLGAVGGVAGKLATKIPGAIRAATSSSKAATATSNRASTAVSSRASTASSGTPASAKPPAAASNSAPAGRQAAAKADDAPAPAAQRGDPSRGGFAHGISADEITAINRGLGGTVELTGSVDTVLANAARRSSFYDKSASVIRDIAGSHLFDDANKRTAQTVVETLMSRNNIMSGPDSATLRSVISKVGSRQLSGVEEIASALRGY